MEELYIEKFFLDKEASVKLSLEEKADLPEKTQSSDSLDKLSQMFLFLRLLKEDCEKLLKKAPFLSLALHKLEKAIYSSDYSEALVLMDELEEFLDLIYR